MDTKDDENLYFITDEVEKCVVDAFLVERTKSEAYEHYGIEETEDETIARHLRAAKQAWLGYPPPHYVLPNVLSRNGGLPPYVLTAWLSYDSEKIVVVVFVDVHPDKTIRQIFQLYCHQIHFKVLAGIDQEEERKMFDWYARD
ncbi:hypothetical protein ACFL00_02770 [Pseudomonadota bacterium]